MSATRLMILGLVHWMQPVHGYDVKRELESWHAEEWANIAPGSIYHALRKLADEGLLEEVRTEQVGSRPARTTYRMTVRGEREFEELLRRYWWEYRPPIDPFQAGFAFLPRLPRGEAVAALRNRARLLRAAADMHRFAIASDFMRRRKPTHVGWTFELVIARMEVEIAWCERVAARLEGGAELFPEDFPPCEGPVGDGPGRSGTPADGVEREPADANLTSSRSSRLPRAVRHPGPLGDGTRINQT